MKKLYWRPQRISARILWLAALAAIAGMALVDTFTIKEKQPYFSEKIKAAKLARRALDVLAEQRRALGLPIDPDSDPSGDGMIGELLTPVTTNPGHLPAKQTSVNPNFAAVIVHLLKRAQVEEGDVVGVGFSGSFPALNVAVMAALATLNLKPIIISSEGSSQWGANIPELMWTDMELELYERRVFPFRSVAVSRGGIDDRALGLSKDGKRLLDEAIMRSGLPFLEVKNYAEGLDKRMEIYAEHSGEAEIKAYINVGGGTSSVGTHIGKKMFAPGLNRSAPRGGGTIDSVMSRFSERQAPVIHLTRIADLAQKYGLPLQPTKPPKVGEGKIFQREVHNIPLVIAVLAGLLTMLAVFVRLDWVHRIFRDGKRDKPPASPERMV